MFNNTLTTILIVAAIPLVMIAMGLAVPALLLCVFILLGYMFAWGANTSEPRCGEGSDYADHIRTMLTVAGLAAGVAFLIVGPVRFNSMLVLFGIVGIVAVLACGALARRMPGASDSDRNRKAGGMPGQPLKLLAGRLVEALERWGLTVDGKPNLVEFQKGGIHFEMSRASDNCMLLQHASESVASPIPIYAAATDDAIRWECPSLELTGMSDDDMPDAVVDKVLELHGQASAEAEAGRDLGRHCDEVFAAARRKFGT